MSQQLTRQDIKNAIKYDVRFRELFPEFKTEFNEFIRNQSCPCTAPLIDKIMQSSDRLKQYFPSKIVDGASGVEAKPVDLWTVINCHIDELNDKLRRLPPGRKQLAIARYEDQVTVVINMLILSSQ